MPTEKQLTEELVVSRTCVREAIKSLESLQLISVRPKIGAIVLEPSPVALINAEYLSTSAYLQQTDSLIELRKILETGLAALAAEKATETDWEKMRMILEEEERILGRDRSTLEDGVPFQEALGKINLQFHKAIAEATRNPLAIMILQAISEPLMERTRRTNEVPGVPEMDLREHWSIYRAIHENNPEKARNAMRLHLQSAERQGRIVQARETA